MSRFLTRSSFALAVMVILFWTAVVVGQSKPSNFKKGQFEFRYGRTAYVVPVSPVGGSLETTAAGSRALTLTYFSTAKPEAASVAIALVGITGPGKFGNSVITSFAVRAGDDNWLFDQSQHNCMFAFSRVQAAGVEARVSCTATRGGAVLWSQGKFTALP